MAKSHSTTTGPGPISQQRVRGWLAEVEAADNPALRSALRELSYLSAAVGLIDGSEAASDHAAARTLIALGHAGIAAEPVARLLDTSADTGTASDIVTVVRDVIEHNPLPDHEWSVLRDALGDELLAELLGISTQSIRRYAGGERAVPDEVAARLHFVALVNGDLIGSYNERGIRRWWQRPRSALDGNSPLAALGTRWDPDQTPAARQVRRLATSLVGAGAST